VVQEGSEDQLLHYCTISLSLSSHRKNRCLCFDPVSSFIISQKKKDGVRPGPYAGVWKSCLCSQFIRCCRKGVSMLNRLPSPLSGRKCKKKYWGQA
jgi:hypothetical protein